MYSTQMTPITVSEIPAEYSDRLPSPCACCGALSLTPTAQSSALLAVCDVLVVRALEAVGKRIVRVERSRFNRLGSQPWHVAHTIWKPDDHTVDKALSGAWDVVPAMLDSHGCCNVTPTLVTGVLDCYVRDLLLTGTGHALPELRYRFKAYLGIDLPAVAPYRPTGQAAQSHAPA